MKQPSRETGLNATPRSKNRLAGLAQKMQALFAVNPAQEDTRNREIMDKGTQRLAQTSFGRLLLRCAQPRQKRKKKRRFPIVNFIFLALFLVMVAISLLGGGHQSASAASAVKGTATSTPTPTPPPTSTGPETNGKCPDGSPVDAHGLCAPQTFDPYTCPGQSRTDAPMSDPCNPWGEYSNYSGTNKGDNAAEWEGLTFYDQVCIKFNGTEGNDNPDPAAYTSPDQNTDLSWRGQYVDGVPITNTPSHIVCNKANTGMFPCELQESQIANDWLSGKPSSAPASSNNAESGHLATTYSVDTLTQGSVQSVYGYMLAAGFLLLVPGLLLSGYRLIISGSSFRHAEALAILPRIFMAAAAIAICSSLIGLMIGFSNGVSSSVVNLHGALPYPAPQAVQSYDGSDVSYYFGYTLAVQGGIVRETPSGKSTSATPEPSTSYRGVVVPIDRWGCAANDFVSILSKSFWTNVFASVIPFFGNFINLAEKVNSAIAIVHHLGEFIQVILSIGIAGQVIFRIIMINFYILTGPLACGCWALPGNTGQRIFGQWFKGIFSLLFTQAAQLFVLTVTPLIMPNLSQINIPTDSMGLLRSIFSALPAIIVLFIALQVPKFIGTSATKAVASAGTMASGAIAAGAAAAYSIAQ